MRRTQNARLETLLRVQDTLKQHLNLVEAYKPIKRRHAELNALIASILDLRVEAGTGTEGSSLEKKAAINSLVKQAVSIAKIALIWAKDAKKEQLIPDLDMEVSDLRYGTILNCIDKAVRLEQALRPHLEDLEDYGINEAKLDTLQDNVDKLRLINPMPLQNKTQTRKMNEQLDLKIKEAMQIADDIEHLIVGFYGETENNFVLSYLASMRIFDPATRSTALQVVVLDQAGMPINKAECDLIELEGEEQDTNEAGLAIIKGIRSGNYTLEIRKQGFQALKTNVDIKRGKKVSLNFKLIKSN